MRARVVTPDRKAPNSGPNQADNRSTEMRYLQELDPRF